MEKMTDQIVTFLRQKDLILKEELGQGASGKTVLLYDDYIDEYYVCKKYAPYDEAFRAELFRNFVREVKLLHMLNHPNVVRVFNYYLYPDRYSGYILMEHVDGKDIEEHLKEYPEEAENMFIQAIEGFAHLEEHGILHRDLRPGNVLVSGKRLLKIIDLGFGKQIESSKDVGKSIELNWWCDPPEEFSEGIYDHATDIYFVGHLFAGIISKNKIEGFRYSDVLRRMCEEKPQDREVSFADIRSKMLADEFDSLGFSDQEISIYRAFSDTLWRVINRVQEGIKYIRDADDVVRNLEELYQKTMLEPNIPHNPQIIGCFMSGTYYYSNYIDFPVDTLKEFLSLLRSSSRDRKNIILANIYSRLDSVSREKSVESDSEIPF